MPEVRVNGIRLYYEERGEGVPIVCIHGVGSAAVAWSDALEKLAEIGRAIAYDRRGSYRSERPTPYERARVTEHGDDAAALLDALEATPAIVIGRSYGGEVATDLALRYPDHVRALVLLEGVPVNLVPATAQWTRDLRDRLAGRAAEVGIDGTGEAMLAEVLGEGAWSGLPEPLREVFTANSEAILAELGGEWLDVDSAALARIEQPVLLVGAADSPPELREPNEVMAAALPNARTVVIGGGHLINPAAQEVIAFIREALERDSS